MNPDERKILLWIKLYKEIGDAGLVCRKCGISRPTFRKWARRYEEPGTEGLCSLSQKSHDSPNQKITDEIRQWILYFERTRILVPKAFSPRRDRRRDESRLI